MSPISVTDESDEGRYDEPSAFEASSEVLSSVRDTGEEEEENREEEENKDQEDYGEEWGMHARSSVRV